MCKAQTLNFYTYIYLKTRYNLIIKKNANNSKNIWLPSEIQVVCYFLFYLFNIVYLFLLEQSV